MKNYITLLKGALVLILVTIIASCNTSKTAVNSTASDDLYYGYDTNTKKSNSRTVGQSSSLYDDYLLKSQQLNSVENDKYQSSTQDVGLDDRNNNNTGSSVIQGNNIVNGYNGMSGNYMMYDPFFPPYWSVPRMGVGYNSWCGWNMRFSWGSPMWSPYYSYNPMMGYGFNSWNNPWMWDPYWNSPWYGSPYNGMYGNPYMMGYMNGFNNGFYGGGWMGNGGGWMGNGGGWMDNGGGWNGNGGGRRNVNIGPRPSFGSSNSTAVTDTRRGKSDNASGRSASNVGFEDTRRDSRTITTRDNGMVRSVDARTFAQPTREVAVQDRSTFGTRNQSDSRQFNPGREGTIGTDGPRNYSPERGNNGTNPRNDGRNDSPIRSNPRNDRRDGSPARNNPREGRPQRGNDNIPRVEPSSPQRSSPRNDGGGAPSRQNSPTSTPRGGGRGGF